MTAFAKTCVSLTLALIGGMEICRSQSSDADSLAPLTAVDGLPRPEDHDLVQLANGERVSGRIVNETLTLHTAFGSLALPAASLAGVEFNSEIDQQDRVVTIQRNRISGFLNDPIQLRSADDTVRTLNKLEVRRIIFGQRPNEATRAGTRRFVILRNGDMLSGAVRNWSPELVAGSTAAVPGLDAIELVQFTEGSTTLQIVLRNGDERTVKLSESFLALELDAGPEIRLPASRVQAIYARSGAVPLFVRREFESASADAPDSGAAAPGPTLEGMVWIAPGRFQMGSLPSEPGHGTDEDPITEVILSRGFWIGSHEVTQAEWTAVMGPNPSGFQGMTNHPVERVTWNEANAYCAKKTALEREAGRLPAGFAYRLPTEAEWEYACRAGTTTPFSFGDDPAGTELARYAWFISNSDSSTQPIGQLEPNPWGLHDLHGNVWEWCHDLWQDAYPGGTVTDPTGPKEGWLRVARGGSWLYDASFCRSANRDNYGPDNRCSDIGFRVVLAPPL